MIAPGLINATRNRLAALRDQVGAIQYAPSVARQYSLAQVNAGIPGTDLRPWLMQQLGAHVRQPALYSIEASTAEAAQIIRASMDLARADPNRTYALPRDNNRGIDTLVLYVGSSGKGRIRQRLKQHLWQAAVGTYAMHMARWMPDAVGSVTLRVQSILGEVEPAVVQSLENTLWQSLLPMYGKMGGR